MTINLFERILKFRALHCFYKGIKLSMNIPYWKRTMMGCENAVGVWEKFFEQQHEARKARTDAMTPT